MQKPLIAFAAFNVLLAATLLAAGLIVGASVWEYGFNIAAAFIFLFAEAFIVAGTIGPALWRWMGYDDV